jgi:hypothetical protein
MAPDAGPWAPGGTPNEGDGNNIPGPVGPTATTGFLTPVCAWFPFRLPPGVRNDNHGKGASCWDSSAPLQECRQGRQEPEGPAMAAPAPPWGPWRLLVVAVLACVVVLVPLVPFRGLPCRCRYQHGAHTMLAGGFSLRLFFPSRAGHSYYHGSRRAEVGLPCPAGRGYCRQEGSGRCLSRKRRALLRAGGGRHCGSSHRGNSVAEGVMYEA